MTTKAKIKTAFFVVVIAAIASCAIMGYTVRIEPTKANAETSDPCPAPSFVRGFDKETGDTVCGYVTGCPYGDSVPLGPECDKLAPTTPVNNGDKDPTPPDPDRPYYDGLGNKYDYQGNLIEAAPQGGRTTSNCQQ